MNQEPTRPDPRDADPAPTGPPDPPDDAAAPAPGDTPAAGDTPAGAPGPDVPPDDAPTPAADVPLPFRGGTAWMPLGGGERSARDEVDRLDRSGVPDGPTGPDPDRDQDRPGSAGTARGGRSGERTWRADPDRPGRSRGGSRSAARSSRAPQRVRVTSSRMTATARAPARSVSREIDEQTGVGEVYLRSLLRAQLRLGLSVIAVLALALGTLPLTFAVIPRLGNVRVFTVPLPWLLVGVSVYPLLFGVAWWHVLAAERAERDFVAIVESD